MDKKDKTLTKEQEKQLIEWKRNQMQETARALRIDLSSKQYEIEEITADFIKRVKSVLRQGLDIGGAIQSRHPAILEEHKEMGLCFYLPSKKEYFRLSMA